MPKGPTLTKAEREEIATLRASNLSARDIAKRIDRSKTVVLNYLKDPSKYGTTKRSGRKRALTQAQEEQILRALSTGRLGTQDSGADDGVEGIRGPSLGKLSAERIKQEFGLPLSTRRVQQLLSDWRRRTRHALDQQHALSEEHPGEREGEMSNSSAPPPPPTLPVEDQEDDHPLLDAAPPLVLEDEPSLTLPRPTEEAHV